MREKMYTAAVFAASLLALAWNASSPGFGTALVDPIGQVTAQDESVYASSSFYMAAHGDWMTPHYLGRYALYKPPVFYWLSAACAKIFGRTAVAVRIPSILAGAATVALVFRTLLASTSLLPSLTAALLLLSSHVFFVLSRTGLMDSLLTFETAIAMCVLAVDPALKSRASPVVAGCASGLAIMTKWLAGLFPLFGLALFLVISKSRPRLSKIVQVLAITALVALPWHLWQLHAHPRWFWNEYVMTESLEQGHAAPLQTTQESQIGYYATRLALLDPVLLIAAFIGLWRRPSRAAVAFLIVILACALAFRYRNTSYLMPLYPALAMLAAAGIASFNARFANLALALTAIIFTLKASSPDEIWGLPLVGESPAEVAAGSDAALDRYAALHRPNELILVQPEDHFYSSDLDLPRVRYLYLDPSAAPSSDAARAPLDFRHLGITVTADQFDHLEPLLPIFTSRLREFDLDSSAPIATVILARTPAEIDAVIAAHPDADFYTPREFASGVSHDLLRGAASRVFLLSRPKNSGEKVERP